MMYYPGLLRRMKKKARGVFVIFVVVLVVWVPYPCVIVYRMIEVLDPLQRLYLMNNVESADMFSQYLHFGQEGLGKFGNMALVVFSRSSVAGG